MIRYVDTNALIRLLLNDVPEQHDLVLSIIDNHRAGELVIEETVLVELFFVLEFRAPYQYPRNLIVELFEPIIATPQFSINQSALLAFKLYGTKPKLDFTDCLLAIKANMLRVAVITFDKDLLKILK